MAAKKSFVLRIDETTYAALEKWAADEFRSVNGQLEWLIDKALRESGRSPKEKRINPISEEENQNK
ncbi:MAG: Arc family DNA-binding protein [Saprospiraceae bacterium]